MNVAPLLVVLVLTAQVDSARNPLGQRSFAVGAGATMEADVCPIGGEYRVRVEPADPQLVTRLLGASGGVVQSVSTQPDGEGVLVTFQLAPEALFAEATLGATGDLVLRFEGIEPGTAEPTLAEIIDSSRPDRGKTSLSEKHGYLPLGSGSPWSFVSFPLHTPVVEPFLPASETVDANAPLPPLELTTELLDGAEVRKKAAELGGAWWFEAADRFVAVAAAQGDDATHEAALALAGESLYLSGGNDESFEYFDRALASYPDSPREGWYYFGRGLARQGMGRHVEALEDLETASRLLPAADRGLPLAAMVASLASVDRWDTAFELAVMLRRGWPRAFFDPWLEAELAYRAEDIERTETLLKSLESRDDPRRPLVLIRLADCAWIADDSEAFLYWLASARSSGDITAGSMARLRRLEWQILGGEEVSFPTVIADLRAVAEAEPRAGLEVALAEAQYLHDSDMLLEACRLDRHTLRNYPDFPAADVVETRMCRAADVMMQVAREADEPLYEAGIYLDFVDGRQAAACADPELLHEGIAVLESLGLWDEARRSLSALMVHDGLEPEQREDVVLHLAELYLNMGRTADGLKSIDYYWNNLETHTLRTEADLLAAELIFARGGEGDAEKAMETSGQLLQRDLASEQRRRASRLRGLAAYHLEEWSEAATGFEQARRLREQDLWWHQDGLLLGWSLVRADRLEEARSILDEVDPQQLAPAARAPHGYLRARVYRATGHEDEAEAMLEAVRASGESTVWPRFAELELDALVWERQFEDLVSIPEPGKAPSAESDQSPSEL